jgi:uncharacterized protein YecE (DUF72 family)
MANYYFGIAGWSYPDWKGIVYPDERPLRFDDLAFISTFFDAIELNNTFYRIPASKIVEAWARRVAHNSCFRYTAKLWQGFTHEKKQPGENEVKQFLEAMEPLQKSGRLGALLAQFPVSFKNEESAQERLQWIVQRFRNTPLVVEFRNRSWINPDVLNWLEENALGFCNVDEPIFRQMIKPSSVVTSSTAYVRLHGRNYKNWFMKGGNRDTRYDYLYTEEELDQWIPRIREMGKKSKHVYVIGNNHFRGQAPANILQLKSKTVQQPVNVPESLQKSFPQLKKIAENKKKGQTSLFDD